MAEEGAPAAAAAPGQPAAEIIHTYPLVRVSLTPLPTQSVGILGHSKRCCSVPVSFAE